MSLGLFAGGLALLISFLGPEPAPPERRRVAAPLATKVLVVTWRGVPEAMRDWPELTPFFADVRSRGRGGRLADDASLAGLRRLATDGSLEYFAPAGKGVDDDSDDLSAADSAALEGAEVFDRHRSCILSLTLDSIDRAVTRHGPALRTDNGSAGRTALAIRALDQRTFEAARRAGSRAVLLLVHQFGDGARYAMAGPGIAVEDEDRDVSGELAAETVGAVLGFAAGRAEALEGIEFDADERRVHEDASRELRMATDEWESTRSIAWFTRRAALIMMGMGVVVFLRRPQKPSA